MRTLLAGWIWFAAIFFFILFPTYASAQTIVSAPSTISAPTTWTLANSPYVVRGSGTITVSSVLTIEPGVMVKFEPRRRTSRFNGLRVTQGGRLLAEGTIDHPILFTSGMDDGAGGNTDVEGGASTGIPGDWNGIVFDGDDSRLSHVVIRYGGNLSNSFGNITARGASHVEIRDSEMRESGWNGIWLEGLAAPIFERVRIENNSGVGVDATRAAGPAVIADSVVQGNVGALRLSVENKVDIRNTRFLGNFPQSAVLVGDTISRDTRWPNLLGLVYEAPSVGRITVAAGATLTIDPGVVVRMPRRAGLYVRGALSAVGTPDSPIVFTSMQTLPLPGDWGGIYFDRASGTLSHVTLGYGGLFQDDFGGASWGFTSRNVVTVDNSAVTLRNVTIADGLDTGVYSFGASLLALNNSIVRQTPRGVFVHTNDSMHMRGNSFASTTEYALYSAGSVQMDVRENWWGSETGPTVASNPAGQGEKIVGNVLYDPWIGKAVLRDPVILIPGILGTEMRRWDEVLWLDLGRTLTDSGDEFMEQLAMNEDGTPTDESVRFGDAIRSIELIGLPAFHYFDRIIDELTVRGYSENVDLFVFPYDWRLDFRTNSDRLNSEIERIIAQTGAKRVDVVAHSMGGVVAKQYILVNGADRVDSLVFLGTPHVGSPKAAKALLFGDNLDIPFLAGEEIRNIGRNMLSLYQLLPGSRYFSLLGSYFDDLAQPFVPDYAGTMAFLASQGLNGGHLNKATALHTDTLDNFSAPGVNTYNISGCREPSVSRIIRRNDNDEKEDEYYLVLTAGDGTVPLGSSDAVDIPADHRFYLQDTTHSKMPSENGVRELVADIISGTLDIQNLPENIIQDSTACRIRGRVVSVHSPVDFHAYDGNGNHVGPSASGKIDYDIPGAGYENVANNKFIFLPEGADYTIALDATVTGTFSMRVAEFDGDEITETTYYNDISIVPDSAGVMILHADGTHSDLELDASIIPPSAVLTARESQDFARPSTTILLAGTEGRGGWFRSAVGVSFFAEDDNSGILKTEYSVDNGATWLNVRAPFQFETEGEHRILYYSVDRAGNKEAVQEARFRIDTTPPEASIGFNPYKQEMVIAGIDAYEVTVSTTARGAMISDPAGNTLEIVLQTWRRGNTLAFRVDELLYNGEARAIKRNYATVHVSFDKAGNFRRIGQFMHAHHDFHMTAMYNEREDETMITGLDQANGQKTKERLPALRLPHFRTDQGSLRYLY